jgi:hypothetical protein
MGGIVGWCGRGDGGGAYLHSSMHEGEGAGAQKTRNPSHIGSVSVCILAAAGGGGSVVSQGPLPWYPRWWLVGSEMVW